MHLLQEAAITWNSACERARALCPRLLCPMPLLPFLLLALPALVNCRPQDEPAPSVRIELQRLGFRPYLQKYPSDAEFFKHPYFLDDYNPRVAFIDDDTLVAFYVRKDEATYTGKDKLNRNNPLMLDALLIDLAVANAAKMRGMGNDCPTWDHYAY